MNKPYDFGPLEIFPDSDRFFEFFVQPENWDESETYDHDFDEHLHQQNEAKIARLLGASPDLLAHIKLLADYLKESHDPEMEAKHFGDKEGDCSYCAAILKADALYRTITGKEI
jgi:hypothetical protein